WCGSRPRPAGPPRPPGPPPPRGRRAGQRLWRWPPPSLRPHPSRPRPCRLTSSVAPPPLQFTQYPFLQEPGEGSVPPFLQLVADPRGGLVQVQQAPQVDGCADNDRVSGGGVEGVLQV